MSRTYQRTCPECGVLYETDDHLDDDLCLRCGERRWVFARERRPRRLTPPQRSQ